MLVTRKELEELGAKEIQNRKDLILSKTNDESYLNPLFMGCCIKWDEITKLFDKTNAILRKRAIQNKEVGYYHYKPAIDEFDLYSLLLMKPDYTLEFVKNGELYWVEQFLPDIEREYIKIPYGVLFITREQAIKDGIEEVGKMSFLKRRKFNTQNERQMLMVGARSFYERWKYANDIVSNYNEQQAIKMRQKSFTSYSTKNTVNDIYQSLETIGYFSASPHPLDNLIKQGITVGYLAKLYKKALKQEVREKRQALEEKEREQFYRDMEMGFFDD